MDKKTGAIGLKPIVYLIIFIISALLITTLYLSLGDVGKEVQEGLACHLMLGARDITDLGPANIIIPQVQANCRTISKTLPENSKNLYDLQLELANTIANTMWIIHHGNVADAWDKGFWEKDQCFIMYTLSFETTRRLSTIEIRGSDLINFLASNFYMTIDDVPYTYLDYVLNHPSRDSDVAIVLLIKNMTFKPENTYAISVSSGQKNTPFWEMVDRASKGAIVGLSGGAAVGTFVVPGLGTVAGGIIGGIGGFVSGIASATWKQFFEKNKKVYTISFLPLEDAIKGGCYTR